MSDSTKTAPAFEVEVGLDKFLELLEHREEQEAPRASYQLEERSAVRRSVFVTKLYDQKATSVGVPSVKRYVVASFAYGEDLVTHTRITSVGMEMPEVKDGDAPAKRQDAAYEEIRAEIAGRIEDRGWEVPVLEGFLHHAKDPRAKGGA